MNKWAGILLGLILLLGAIVVAWYSQDWVWIGVSWNFWNAAWVFLKGGIVWFIIMIGLLFLMLGISDLRE